MTRVTIKKSDEVEVKPFLLEDFIKANEMDGSIKKITKKELKNIAESLDMSYTEEEILFAKKMITAYLKNENGKR